MTWLSIHIELQMIFLATSIWPSQYDAKGRYRYSGFIAGGCGKNSRPEFVKSLDGAIALPNRLEYYGIMARDLQFFSGAIFKEFEEKVI